jgi:hypothetical protein
LVCPSPNIYTLATNFEAIYRKCINANLSTVGKYATKIGRSPSNGLQTELAVIATLLSHNASKKQRGQKHLQDPPSLPYQNNNKRIREYLSDLLLQI